MLDRNQNRIGQLRRRLAALGPSALRLRNWIGNIFRPLRWVFTVLLVLILLFEEWGWQPLVWAFGWLARWRPLAMLEEALAGLPPYGALAVFALPAALLVPFKLLALYLLAQNAPVSALLVFLAAKIVGTGLVGRIYLITKPQLMQIGLFAYAYSVFVPWKDAVFAYARSSWAWRWGRLLKIMAKRRFEKLKTRWWGGRAGR